MQLDLATVLLQWAAGGLAFCWFTTRHRLVGLGYGWLVRSVFGALALGGVVAGLAEGDGSAGATVRDAAGLVTAALASAALVASVVQRRAGLDGPGAFNPRLDLLAPVAGVVAVLGAAAAVGGPYALSATRLLVGGAFLGSVTDAMLLGHWYLVQPGLSREPVQDLVRLSVLVWPVEVAILCVPVGMIDVLDGTIDDGYGGLLGVTWLVSALTTLGLLVATRRALREPYYSAVMAATGLLYLAILTAFGTDVLARATFAT